MISSVAPSVGYDPNWCHREGAKSSRELFAKVRVNTFFFGISGFGVGFRASNKSFSKMISLKARNLKDVLLFEPHIAVMHSFRTLTCSAKVCCRQNVLSPTEKQKEAVDIVLTSSCAPWLRPLRPPTPPMLLHSFHPPALDTACQPSWFQDHFSTPNPQVWCFYFLSLGQKEKSSLRKPDSP